MHCTGHAPMMHGFLLNNITARPPTKVDIYPKRLVLSAKFDSVSCPGSLHVAIILAQMYHFSRGGHPLYNSKQHVIHFL